MERRLPPRLVAVSPGVARGSAAALDLGRYLKRLFEAGLEGCVLREPGLDDADLYALAMELRAAFPSRDGYWLCVHDRVHVAVAAGADAAHLGFRSLTLQAARRAARSAPALGLGLSTHAGDDPATWSEADYVFHGPVFDTPSKVGWVEPIGIAGLERAVGAGVPLLALGGITPDKLGAVLATGVHGAAVLGALAGAPRPEEVLQQFVSKLDESGIQGERP